MGVFCDDFGESCSYCCSTVLYVTVWYLAVHWYIAEFKWIFDLNRDAYIYIYIHYIWCVYMCIYDKTLIIIFFLYDSNQLQFFHVNGGMILTWKSQHLDIPRTISNVTKNIISKTTYMNTNKDLCPAWTPHYLLQTEFCHNAKLYKVVT